MYDTKKVSESVAVMENQMPLEVVDQASYDQAVDFGKNVSKMLKYIKGEKEKITKPMNEAVKAARAIFKPFEDRCEEVKADTKSKMTAYLTAEEVKRKAQEVKDLARMEKGTMKEETVVKKMVKREEDSTETKGSTFKYLAIKSVDLKKVPVEYLVLDETKAKADYKEGKEVAGVEFEYEIRAKF